MSTLLARIRRIYHEYPRAFWIYNVIVFIDRLGGFMLYPFFALYLTKKFEIGMSTVGILFAVFSISGMIGSALGGAIADRMGRKVVIVCSLILSSFSALGMGFAPTILVFVAVVVVVGHSPTSAGPPTRPWSPTCCRRINAPKAMASSAWSSIWRSSLRRRSRGC